MPQLSRSRVKLCFIKGAVLYTKAAWNVMHFMLMQFKHNKTESCHIPDTHTHTHTKVKRKKAFCLSFLTNKYFLLKCFSINSFSVKLCVVQSMGL